jgi:hypothetical protein
VRTSIKSLIRRAATEVIESTDGSPSDKVAAAKILFRLMGLAGRRNRRKTLSEKIDDVAEIPQKGKNALMDDILRQVNKIQ